MLCKRQDLMSSCVARHVCGCCLQAKARELFEMAVKQGHFRNERMSADGTRAELNLHALTAGVAMLSLQSFLLDMQ
jgi:pentatricopeptide repeat domain-containing protein 1